MQRARLVESIKILEKECDEIEEEIVRLENHPNKFNPAKYEINQLNYSIKSHQRLSIQKLSILQKLYDELYRLNPLSGVYYDEHLCPYCQVMPKEPHRVECDFYRELSCNHWKCLCI